MAAADCVSRNHCNNRFGACADVALEVEHIEPVYPFAVGIAGVASYFLVSA